MTPTRDRAFRPLFYVLAVPDFLDRHDAGLRDDRNGFGCLGRQRWCSSEPRLRGGVSPVDGVFPTRHV